MTMPREAADDYSLARELLHRGMNCMRINCAHDDADTWRRMVANLRRAEQEIGTPCRVLMDLAGPKLRTGPVETGPCVLKWRLHRDPYGRVISPALVWLTPNERAEPPPSKADASLPVRGRWLARTSVGDQIAFTDARGASRTLNIVAVVGDGRWAEARKTAYVTPGLRLHLSGSHHAKRSPGRLRGHAEVGDLPPLPQPLLLSKGEVLTLTRHLIPGKPASCDAHGQLLAPATIGCTLPEFFTLARPHERIWFDDGKIGGIITSVTNDQIHVAITEARTGGRSWGRTRESTCPIPASACPP